jgi:hypothetical protein
MRRRCGRRARGQHNQSEQKNPSLQCFAPSHSFNNC